MNSRTAAILSSLGPRDGIGKAIDTCIEKEREAMREYEGAVKANPYHGLAGGTAQCADCTRTISGNKVRCFNCANAQAQLATNSQVKVEEGK